MYFLLHPSAFAIKVKDWTHCRWYGKDCLVLIIDIYLKKYYCFEGKVASYQNVALGVIVANSVES